jgi:K+ transporter
MLSDRLVTQNGVMLMGIAAVITLILTGGSLKLLVVLYSINVFIDFCLAQSGMVRYWWRNRVRMPAWKGKMCINSIGLALTSFILVSVLVLKFHEGGWVTLVITSSLVCLCLFIKKHYLDTAKVLKRLDPLMHSVTATLENKPTGENPYEINADSKVAVVLVNGFNGLGLHTLFNVVKYFGREFKGFIFVEVGVVDAGNFKGIDEVERLNLKVKEDLVRYVAYMRSEGFWAEGISSVGIDAISQVDELAGQIIQRFPSAIFFGGQLVFGQETMLTRLLHNNTIFAMQSHFYPKGIPFVILPIRV